QIFAPSCAAGRRMPRSPNAGAARCGTSRPVTASTPPTSSAPSVRWEPSVADVLVRYFAAAAEAAGREEEHLPATTVGELRETLLASYPAMAAVLAKGSFLVDGIVTRDPARALGSRVDVLPPFSGG